MTAFFRENPERRDHVASKLSEIDRARREPDGARVSVGQTQERVDKVGETVDLLEHAAHRLLVLRWRARFAESGLTNTANDGQRRAELVRRVGRKAAQLAERRLEAGEGLVDDRRQPADLVVLIRHRQTLVQTVCGDALRL